MWKQYSDVEKVHFGSRLWFTDLAASLQEHLKTLWDTYSFSSSLRKMTNRKVLTAHLCRADISQETIQHFRARRIQAHGRWGRYLFIPCHIFYYGSSWLLCMAMDLGFDLSVSHIYGWTGLLRSCSHSIVLLMAVFFNQRETMENYTIRVDKSQNWKLWISTLAWVISFLPLFSLPNRWKLINLRI